MSKRYMVFDFDEAVKETVHLSQEGRKQLFKGLAQEAIDFAKQGNDKARFRAEGAEVVVNREDNLAVLEDRWFGAERQHMNRLQQENHLKRSR